MLSYKIPVRQHFYINKKEPPYIRQLLILFQITIQ